MSRLTYMPLRRNRYRCNQTGEIISQAKLKAHRRSTKVISKPASKLASSTEDGSLQHVIKVFEDQRRATCPKCKGRFSLLPVKPSKCEYCVSPLRFITTQKRKKQAS